MRTIVEADWITKAGFRAVVVMTHMGHRCGYVGVPSTHTLHGCHYAKPSKHLKAPLDEPIGQRGVLAIMCAADDKERMTAPDNVFDVHGSITYSNNDPVYPVESENLWWFGYDCGHAGDARDLQFVDLESRPHITLFNDGVIRSLKFCQEQCESLAQQLIDRIVSPCA